MRFGVAFNLKGLRTKSHATRLIKLTRTLSDVLAELDLPPSGISRLEDAMPLPSCVAHDAETKEDDPLMWMYYLAQIALRKLLNRAHTTLYNKGWYCALEGQA